MLPEKFTSRMLTLVPSATTKYRVKILALLLSLCAYSNSICDHTWLYHEAMLPPSKAPWNHLFLHGNHWSFLLMTGLTREALICFTTFSSRLVIHLYQNVKGVSGHWHPRVSWDCFCFTSVAQWTTNTCVWFLVWHQMPVLACWGICWNCCEKVTLSSFSKDQISQPGQNAIVCIND